LIFNCLSPDNSDIDEINSGLSSQEAIDPSRMGEQVFPPLTGIRVPGSAVTATGTGLSAYCCTCCCHLDLPRLYQPEQCTVEGFGMFSGSSSIWFC